MAAAILVLSNDVIVTYLLFLSNFSFITRSLLFTRKQLNAKDGIDVI